MPSTSKAQQKLMGMAYSLKKGDMDPKDASQEVKDLADSMTLQQLKDFASTSHEGLPDYVKEGEDHEVGMAMGQIEAIKKAVDELLGKIGQVEKNLPGWIQGHITSAYEYLKQANDNFHELEEGVSPANIGGMGATLLPTATQPGSGDVLSGSGDAEEEYLKRKKERKDYLATRKKFKTFEQYINEGFETPVNTFANDEKQEGYDAKVFLGQFDGRSFKAQVCTKLWPDGVPVTKHFSKFQDVKLKGEFQLVDSDRGWWYIQGPKGAWYAVKHADYGTPPFEY